MPPRRQRKSRSQRPNHRKSAVERDILRPCPGGPRRLKRQQKCPICRYFKPTPGLEPAPLLRVKCSCRPGSCTHGCRLAHKLAHGDKKPCKPGYSKRSRKPLSVVRRIEGSNPSPSAQPKHRTRPRRASKALSRRRTLSNRGHQRIGESAQRRDHRRPAVRAWGEHRERSDQADERPPAMLPG